MAALTLSPDNHSLSNCFILLRERHGNPKNILMWVQSQSDLKKIEKPRWAVQSPKSKKFRKIDFSKTAITCLFLKLQRSNFATNSANKFTFRQEENLAKSTFRFWDSDPLVIFWLRLYCTVQKCSRLDNASKIKIEIFYNCSDSEQGSCRR